MVESRTTVLTPGTVEDRNKHTVNTPEMDEMEQFTSGDAKFGVMSETRAFFTVWIFLTRLPAPMVCFAFLFYSSFCGSVAVLWF